MNISIKNINKAFNAFPALHDVCLDIPEGKLVALLGPSGSGKTTLLRVIAGLENPDSGRIFFEDNDVTDLSPAHRKVGFVFQQYALFRHMTVEKNVGFGMSVQKASKRPSRVQIKKRVDELLSLVQLDGLGGRRPSQLSGGQRQRVALARALAMDPAVLLLDEPFGALDAKVRKELRRWLRDFHDTIDITSLFVTHDQEEALELADVVVVLNKGRIEQIGTPREVYDSPANPFVYEFLGEVNRVTLDDRTVYVRPHEWIVSTEVSSDTYDVAGKVVGLHDAGPIVHFSVAVGDDRIQVDLSPREFRRHGFRVGDTIYLKREKDLAEVPA